MELRICSSRLSSGPEFASSGCSQRYTVEKRGPTLNEEIPGACSYSLGSAELGEILLRALWWGLVKDSRRLPVKWQHEGF